MFLVVAATAALIAGSASYARADEDRVVARVPFNFVVGNAQLPAGTYSVGRASMDGAVLAITRVDGRESTLAATIQTGDAAADQVGQSELLFEKVENQYYLARVISPDNNREIVGLPAVDHQRAAEVRHVIGSHL